MYSSLKQSCDHLHGQGIVSFPHPEEFLHPLVVTPGPRQPVDLILVPKVSPLSDGPERGRADGVSLWRLFPLSLCFRGSLCTESVVGSLLLWLCCPVLRMHHLLSVHLLEDVWGSALGSFE